MKKSVVFLVAIVALFVAACSSSSNSKVVGVWKLEKIKLASGELEKYEGEDQEKRMLSIKADGTYSQVIASASFAGKWEVNADNTKLSLKRDDGVVQECEIVEASDLLLTIQMDKQTYFYKKK